ncbi:hypothetical protein P8452_34109 [Trifolium repens]|nr:hypothetical protein P8452_34109 [Trifolium repens]
MDSPRFSLSITPSLHPPRVHSHSSPLSIFAFFFLQLSSHFLLRFFNNPSFLSSIFFCMSLKICLGVDFDMIVGIKE